MNAEVAKNTPKLGFGLMRLPRLDNGCYDMPQLCRMVDRFLAEGMTYFDTAYVYDDGNSERAAWAALVSRHPREAFTLATKVNVRVAKSAREAQSQFYGSLERTGAGYFDYYLLHALQENRLSTYEEYGLWEFAAEQKEKGLIKNLGFSFHDSPEVLDKILTAHPEADFVQLQINYVDWDDPRVAARANYEVARKHGKPVVIMEPVKGGMLATPPESVEQTFKEVEPENSVASWAVRFAADLEGVITVLSGMSNVEQMKDNLSYMKNFTGLSEEQKKVLARAQEELKKIPLIPCTSCNYCAKVCPQGIGISGSFTAMNYLTLYRDPAAAKHQEDWLVSGHGRRHADECVQCGKCEEVCPQHIEIRDLLLKVSDELLR